MTIPLYRTGIIGLGRIGFTLGFDRKREQPASHSKAFACNSRIRLSGGYDRDLAKMALWSKSYPKAKIYDNLFEMLQDGTWDILVIAVNESEHLNVAEVTAPFRPRLIVLEKPVAPNLKDALEIKKVCEKNKLNVCVNHERRFSKDYIFAKEMVESKKLGELKSVSAWLFSPNSAFLPHDESKGRGTLIHDGTHLLDAVRYLTGREISVLNKTTSGENKKGKISGITLNGKIGEVTFSAGFGFETKAFGFEIELLLEKGRIRIGNGILEIWEAKKSPFYEGFYSLAKNNRFSAIKKTGYFSGMVAHCVDFLDGKSPILSTLDDGIEALRTAYRILK